MKRICSHVRQNWELFLVMLVFVAAVGHAVHAARVTMDGHFHYSVDDAYIHMAMAKNLVRHGVWGMTPFHFSSSSSSPLWTLLLAVSYFLFGVNGYVPLLLNILCGLLILAVAHFYLKRFGVNRLFRLVALAAILLVLPMVALVIMGMEHNLHMLLTVWFAGAALSRLGAEKETAAGSSRSAHLAILAGLLVASRYEGLFLVGLVSLAFLARRRFLPGLSLVLAAALPVVTIGIVSVACGWYFFPNSLLIKAGGEKFSVLSALFKPVGRQDWVMLSQNPDMIFIVGLGLVMFAVQLLCKRRGWQPAVLLPPLLIFMVLLHAHYCFSPSFWSYRYSAYLDAFAIFAAAVVLGKRTGARTDRGFRRLLLPCLALATLLAASAYLIDFEDAVVPGYEIDSSRENYFEHLLPARFISRFYSRAPVAVNDIGAVCFYSEADIIDIFGLGDKEPLAIRRESGRYGKAEVASWTGARGARIAMLQVGWHLIVPIIPDRWIKVAEVSTPGNRRVGFFAVQEKEAPKLRRSLLAFFTPLLGKYGYRLQVF